LIFGIGTDISDIRRVRAAWERRGERFAQRVLGPHEIQVFRTRFARSPARGITFLATRFAAKEAFSKAVGMGMRMPMTWRDCEVVNAPSGKPQVRLHNALADWFNARQLIAHVSVTDEADYAAAFVVVETDPES
jgi:holo-[acyl-carrier-protein] synthase